MESFIDPSTDPAFGGPAFGGPIRPPFRGLPPPGVYKEKGLPENKNIPPHEEPHYVLGSMGMASLALGNTKTIIVATLLVMLSMYLFFTGHPSLATIPLGIIIGGFTIIFGMTLLNMIDFGRSERERVNRNRSMM